MKLKDALLSDNVLSDNRNTINEDWKDSVKKAALGAAFAGTARHDGCKNAAIEATISNARYPPIAG